MADRSFSQQLWVSFLDYVYWFTGGRLSRAYRIADIISDEAYQDEWGTFCTSRIRCTENRQEDYLRRHGINM